ncbi:hypothetical protein DIS24_g12597, partial [Lasiodiplodia hormozganensis]
ILSSMQSSQYSDMKIKDSNGHIYKAHKLVVCTQSDFFKNALKENTFKESHDNLVHLPTDDPAAVRAMIQYMYTGAYGPSPIFFGDVAAMLLFHVNVHALADKYRVGDTAAVRKLANAKHANNANNSLCFSLHVPAHKNQTLGQMACERLEHDLEELWPLASMVFPRVVKAVYESTREGDEMRKIVVRIAAKHTDALLLGEEEGSAEGSEDSVSDDEAQGEGEGGQDQDDGEGELMNSFGRDLCAALAKERDRLLAQLEVVQGMADAHSV